MTPLARLLAAVEADDITTAILAASSLWGRQSKETDLIVRIMKGSTDAAISLCETMLPGVRMDICGPLGTGDWMVNLPNQDSVFHPDPARALLIAVLRALVQKGGE